MNPSDSGKEPAQKQASLPTPGPPVSPEQRLAYTHQVLQSVRPPQQPPPGFDPLHATPAELQSYGLPPRPDKNKAPQAAARWEQLMIKTRDASMVVPTFKIRPRDRNPLAVKIRPQEAITGSEDVVVYDSSNWAGAIIFKSDVSTDNDSDYFNAVLADWVVPDPKPGEDNVDYWCSDAWVGIDGWTSVDVLQGGTTQDVFYDEAGKLAKDIYAWYEWYPAYAIEITNVPVQAGDYVYCEVWATDRTTGNFYIYNETTGQYTTVTFSAPNGYSLQGDSAEWIVEDRIGNSLADFGSITFWYCWAEIGTDWKDLADADLIYLEESGGDEATAQIKDENTLVVTYDG
ncbi:hypothetical protein AYL99_08273 [Fonsecaea erecta]|uniref:Uncharacterized protein n=1 Tax=Fonsecaea erecta TaxID=1367422 RepID=A0A178ZEQ0_9EURO|nr:hypothetical protein AYL99_08273 [Fonsecaea erecta]OAP57535.1 hypothetical protein AYL99_08273 [Fonsecaea erecta]